MNTNDGIFNLRRGARKARTIGRSLVGLHNARLHRIGKAPGLEGKEFETFAQAAQGKPGHTRVTCIDYSPDQVQTLDVTNIDEFVAQHRPDWSAVRWINVDGLSNLDAIRKIAEKYELHPLAVEDVLHIPQRPKVEPYDETPNSRGRLFIIARMVQMSGDHPQGEQVSMFLGHNTVITFQEKPPPSPEELKAGKKSDVFDPLRTRINTKGSRVRLNDAGFLVYSLLDAIVDEFFPILEFFSDKLEDLEDEVLAFPSRITIAKIHEVKRSLLLLRRAAWPMREVIGAMAREQHECLTDVTRTYFRDVYDHAVQILDMVETYREFASGLTETYMTAMSNRMNEIMKVLTIITTIFVPLTFLAGVYGMNMDHIPELHWKYSYPAFWGVCLVMAATMIWWFKRRGWI